MELKVLRWKELFKILLLDRGIHKNLAISIIITRSTFLIEAIGGIKNINPKARYVILKLLKAKTDFFVAFGW